MKGPGGWHSDAGSCLHLAGLRDLYVACAALSVAAIGPIGAPCLFVGDEFEM